MHGKAEHVARPAQKCCPLVNSSETCTDQCSAYSRAAHYSRPKISNLPQFTSMHCKLKSKTIAINTGQLAYTFIKLGDNLNLLSSVYPPLQHLSYSVCLKVRGEIIRTVLCCIVYDSCAQ